MTLTKPQWWIYPFKPVRVQESIFEREGGLGNYILERKFDGWRVLVISEAHGVSLWTREKTRIEMPDNLKSQIEDLNLPEGTVLDGEIWTPEKRGAWRHNKKVPCRLTLWDVIKSGKNCLSNSPLEERRKELELLLERKTQDVEIVEWLPATKEAYAEVKREAELFREKSQSRSGFIHGAVLKRRGSPRRDNVVRCIEHADWLKIVVDGMNSGS